MSVFSWRSETFSRLSNEAGRFGLLVVTASEEHTVYEGSLPDCMRFVTAKGLDVTGKEGRVVGFVGFRAYFSPEIWTYMLGRSGEYVGIIHRGSESGDRWMLFLKGVSDYGLGR